MAALLRAVVLLLSSATVVGLSASASSTQDAERPHKHAERHSGHPESPHDHVKRHSGHPETPHHHAKQQSGHQHQHQHHNAGDASAQLIAEDGSDDVRLSIAAKGGLERNVGRDNHGIVRREATDDGQERQNERHYRTAIFTQQEGEPHVSCGKHTASECSACVLQHQSDWCHGDCIWDEDQGCITNTQTTEETTTTDKYPGNDETSMSDDAIADKLRTEQEEAEEQERKDRNKFWATVGISAGGSALLIMTCGLFAICFVLQKQHNAKAAEEPKIEEEPLLEGEGDEKALSGDDEKAASEGMVDEDA